MKNFLARFRSSEDGAITVEWVVLTAAMVGLLVAVMATLGAQTETTATNVGTFIGSSTEY